MNKHKTKKIVFLAVWIIVYFLMISPLFAIDRNLKLAPVTSEPPESWVAPIDSGNLWQLSRVDMILRNNPKVISALFYSLVTIKGNVKNAVKKIDSEIINCDANQTEQHSCYLDRLKQKKRNQTISHVFISPLHVLSFYRLFHVKGMDIVRVNWSSTYNEPAYWKIDDFFHDMQIQKETKYYKLRKNIHLIQIVPDYTPYVFIAIPSKMRINLQKVYKKLNFNPDDRIYLSIEQARKKRISDVLVVKLRMQARKVKINNIEMNTLTRAEVNAYSKM